MFKNWNWEDTWLALLWLFVASLVFAFTTYVFAKKPTIRYSLGDKDGQLMIVREIEWYEDDKIQLDRNVPYWDAIHMVDSLNKTLKR